MSHRIEIGCAFPVADPKTFLTRGFETGVIPFALGSQSVDTLKTQAVAVNGKPIIVGNGLVFGTTPVFLAVVPVFVIAGTLARFGLAEGTAEFLAQAAVTIGCFAILVHGKAGVADQIADGQLRRVLGIPLVERDDRIPFVEFLHSVVNVLFIISLVTDEGAFIQGKKYGGTGQDILCHGSVMNVGRGGQFIERQAGNAVYQDMVLITPVIFEFLFVVLVGGSMNAEGAVRIRFGVVVLAELVLRKRLGIVL